MAAFTDKPAESSRWLPLFSRCRFTFGYPVRTQQLFSVLLLAYPGIPASCAAFGCNTADNLWFGLDEGSKLVIIFLASFFPLFLNTYSGIKGCDRKLLEVGRSLHFTAWQQARLIQLPAALPAIAVGLQLSLGYSWRALIGAELIAASSGIGYMILDAEQMSRPDIVLVGLFAIGIVGSLIDWLFLALTNKILPWNTETGDKYAA